MKPLIFFVLDTHESVGEITISATFQSAGAELIPPYQGRLVNLVVEDARAAEMKATAKGCASLTLDERGLCDLELLAVGGFSPLTRFHGKADYTRVVDESRLADGTFWPIPITLPVRPGNGVDEGNTIALRDVYGNLLAFLHIEEIFTVDNPGQSFLKTSTRLSVSHSASGKLEVIRTPPHFDFVDLRRTPRQLRDHFQALGWSKVVAFPATKPLYRADEELTRRVARQIGGGLLIQPAVGSTQPGDVDHYTRIRCYRAALEQAYTPDSAVLNLLPLAMKTMGPRELLLDAIVRRNYGCSHLIVGLVDDTSEIDGNGNDSGLSEQTRVAFANHQDEVGVVLVEAEPMVYLPETSSFRSLGEVPPGVKTAVLSESEVVEDYLNQGILLPDWFCRPAVSAILKETHPPKFRQGLTIWFTGLSGSGKSTVAHALVERLAEYGRSVSSLDGDEIRTHLSKGLGFSKEDRDANINRVGYVAGLVAQHGGTTICSVISPYRASRDNARKASKGNFVEIFCDTPIEVCESRDVKGHYAKARTAVVEGKGLGFTGVDDPYEAPLNPEVTLDTSQQSVEVCVDTIIEKLIALGYLRSHGATSV